MIRAAIFDVDGVLLDSVSIWEDAGAIYLEKMGLKPEKDLGRKLWTMSIPEAALYLKENYRLDLLETEIEEGIKNTVRDFYFYDARMKKGAKELLASLKNKNIPMVIATSSNEGHIKRAFERLGINEYFNGIVTCEMAKAGKSRPDVYNLAAEKLLGKTGAAKCIRNEIFVFEDSLYAIQTAKNAGFCTVGIYDEYSSDDEKSMRETADFYFYGLSDIKEDLFNV